MNKKEFINYASDKSGVPRYKIRESLEAIVDGIAAAIEEGSPVQINGFGIFTVKEQAARKGNVHGKQIDIPARLKPIFKPGTELYSATERGSENWKSGGKQDK